MMQRRNDWFAWALVFAFFVACRAPDAGSDVIRRLDPPRVIERGPDEATIERGRYLVEHVAACPDCHSPRREHDEFDRERWLSGMDCFVDMAPDDPALGCLSTANLTNHETGLENRTDQQISWNADGSDALFVPDGVTDALGTEHDVPNASACWTCHAGEPGRVLGFSAVQQPDAPAELFAVAPPSRFVPPGDDVARAALGYLHANCGHCHNAHGSARPDTDMDLRLSVSEQKPEQTAAYRTTVGRSLRAFDAPGLRVRVARGQPEQSALVHRMLQRQNDTAMPPLGSERVDPAGIAAVAAWIEAL